MALACRHTSADPRCDRLGCHGIDLVEAPAHPLPGGAAEASAAPAACEAVGAGSVAGGTANLPVDPLPSGSVVYAL